MTVNYSRIWEVMNELEMVTSKVCSAREILDSAINALDEKKLEKVEHLLYATDEFLEYYLKDFDQKFKNAWNETVVKLKMDLEHQNNKSKKWILPIEEFVDGNMETEYFITLPEDLLALTDIKEGDEMEWIDQGDGSFLLKKV